MVEKVTIYSNGEYIEVDKTSLDLPPPLPPPLRTFLFKTEIYARMSDDELDLFDAGIEQAGTRIRLMWRDCTQVEADSPFFPLLMQQLAETFGPARAGQILSLDL